MIPASPRPRPPRERLASLKDSRGSRVTRRPARQKPQRECSFCKSTDIVDVDGAQVCASCGATLNESNIVAEVTFGESAAGAAVVQGGFVGEGARHANTMGPAFRRAGGGMESREVTENQGRDEIRRQAHAIRLADNLADQAFSIYKLAATANFIQGRRVNVVASVCLYVACGRDRNNTTLLMDFSEAISVNVFRLGQTYQDLKKALVLPDNNPLGIRPVIDVENLILKFARKLEFGDSLYKVAEDAARIMKRMKRDWMVTGRRPSGLCGACLILAARMNNFRRTVREVVYVVKVADITVAKRIEEFTKTKSSELTVDQFREYGERLKVQHDPPALYERKAREAEKLRLEQELQQEPNSDAATAQPVTTSRPPHNQELRRDSQGFAIPAIPVDPSLLENSADTSSAEPTNPADSSNTSGDPSDEPPAKKRKYTKRSKTPRAPPPVITDDDLAVEADLEDEMEEILNDPATIINVQESAYAESQARAKALADTLRANPTTTAATLDPDIDPPSPKDTNILPTPTSTARTTTSNVSDDPEIDPTEFDDDPEVANCLLSEAERKIKERIWVTHNEDWLRTQQAKILKKALEEASGGAIGGTKKRKQQRRHSRMGDGSLLEGGTPVEDAADATQRMLEKRASHFSRHINYEKLNSFYAGMSSHKARSGTGTGTGTPAESEAGEAPSMAGTPIATPQTTQEERMADEGVEGVETRTGIQEGDERGGVNVDNQTQAITGAAEIQQGEGPDEDLEEVPEPWEEDEEEEEEAEEDEEEEEEEEEVQAVIDDYPLGFEEEEEYEPEPY